MTAYFCPDCLEVEVSPRANDGRCPDCKPARIHSPSRSERMDQGSRLQQYVHRHNEQTR